MNKQSLYSSITPPQLQLLVEHIHAGVVVHSSDTSVLLSNKEASRLLGLTVEQMQGKVAIDPQWCFIREDGSALPLDEYPANKVLSSLQPFEKLIIGINRPQSSDLVWVLVDAFPEFATDNQLSHVIVTFVDITEQIETQKALAESEANFSKVFQYSPGIMMITTIKDGIIIDTNNKIIQTGYTREELIGKSIFGFNFWFDASERHEFLGKIHKDGKVENFEAKFIQKSGEISTCLISGEIIKFHKTDCIVSVLIDITERKKSENEISILFEIFQGVVQTSDLGGLLKLIHQSLNKILYAENCFFALHDTKTGLFSFPYFVDQYDKVVQPMQLSKSCTSYVFQTGKSILITPKVFDQLKEMKEIELVGPSSPSWIGIPLKTSSRTIGVLVLQHYTEANMYNEHHLKFLDSIASQVANVIERKRAEAELESSLSLISATLESTADGILVVGKNGKITNYNNKFLELWQIPESIIAQGDDETLLSFILEQLVDSEGFLSKVKELYLNDVEISYDLISFKDGRIFERYSQAQILKDTCVGRVWSFRNITVQKETLQALHESEILLRELNATKDKFFSILAHDLKSPFNAILGFSNILSEHIKEKNYEGIEEYSEIIQYSSQKALDLLMNLMEWSRSQSGQLLFKPERIEIGSIISDVFELSNLVAMQKSIVLTKELPYPILAVMDQNMISIVLRNLISNAIKFTHPQGTVSIKAEQMGQELKVTVSDTGIGIKKDELNKLFKIDQIYSKTGTNFEKGTGLGLILCKEFIDKHNGSIGFISEPGIGSQFYFTIPIHQGK